MLFFLACETPYCSGKGHKFDKLKQFHLITANCPRQANVDVVRVPGEPLFLFYISINLTDIKGIFKNT